jgi:hypothetical protein
MQVILLSLDSSKNKKSAKMTTETVSPTRNYENEINKSNRVIDDYIKSIRIMSKRTAYEYLTRLKSF